MLESRSCDFAPQEVASDIHSENMNLILQRLNWEKKKWFNLGLNGTLIHKMVNSIRYWHGKLKRALKKNTIIFTVFNNGKEAILNLHSILKEISNITSLKNVTGFFKVRNPKYIGMEFVNEEMKNFVQQKFKNVGEDTVISLDNISKLKVFEMKVLWLPNIVEPEDIKLALSKYVKVLKIEKDSMLFENAFKLFTGKYNLNVQLLEIYDLDTIPHLLDINGFQALIMINGRQPMCLNCEQIGHISYDCRTPFCKICARNMPISHDCNKEVKRLHKSYADSVKDTEFLYAEDITEVNNEWGNSVWNLPKEPVFSLNTSQFPLIDINKDKAAENLWQNNNVLEKVESSIVSNVIKKKKTPNVVKSKVLYEVKESSLDINNLKQRSEGDYLNILEEITPLPEFPINEESFWDKPLYPLSNEEEQVSQFAEEDNIKIVFNVEESHELELVEVTDIKDSQIFMEDKLIILKENPDFQKQDNPVHFGSQPEQLVLAESMCAVVEMELVENSAKRKIEGKDDEMGNIAKKDKGKVAKTYSKNNKGIISVNKAEVLFDSIKAKT